MDNILIVDDEIPILNMLNKLLTRSGYKVFQAENGQQALEIFNKEDINIVLLDLVLPDIMGNDILKKIKKINPVVEVLIISGRGTYSDVVGLIKDGAYDYLEKPVDNDLLLNKVEHALKQMQMNRKLSILDKENHDIRKLMDYNINVINHMDLGLLTVDKNDILFSNNKYFEKIFNLRSDELENKNIFKIFEQCFIDHERISDLYKDLKKNNRKFNVLFLNNVIVADKEKHHFRISGCRFSEGSLIFINDITDEYNLKQQLIHSERMSMIGQFISSITHGLGNNMANIIANTSGVIDEVELSSGITSEILNKGLCEEKIDSMNMKLEKSQMRLKDYSSRLLKRTAEMNNNIKSLLNYSRNRQQKLVKAPVNINSLIEETINITSSHKYNDIVYNVDYCKDLPLVMVNEYQIRDTLIDLTLNGIQAMNFKGTLDFSTKLIKEDECIRIMVSDNGCGIPDEIKDKVFSAFITSKKNGTGLGLHNVKTIISNHNGNIYFESELNKGTKFYVELPL